MQILYWRNELHCYNDRYGLMFPSLDSNASDFSVFDAHMECSLKV